MEQVQKQNKYEKNTGKETNWDRKNTGNNTNEGLQEKIGAAKTNKKIKEDEKAEQTQVKNQNWDMTQNGKV